MAELAKWVREHPALTAAAAGAALLGVGLYVSSKSSPSAPAKQGSAPAAASGRAAPAAAAAPGQNPPAAVAAAPAANVQTSEANEQKALGNKEYNARNYQKAIDHYTRAIALSAERDCAVFFCNRAACHLALNNFAAVVEDCTAALAIDPKYMKALFRRGQAHEQLHDYKNALIDLTTICLMVKFEEREYMLAVDRVLRQYGTKLAQEHAVSRPPVLPGLYSIASYIESFHGQPSEGLSEGELKALIDSDKNNGALFYRLANHYFQTQNYDKVAAQVAHAVALLDTASSSSDDRAEAQRVLIDALELQGIFFHLANQAAQAVACFDRILALNPDHVNAILRRATTLLEQGNNDAALQAFNTAIRVAPQDPFVYYHRAQCHLVKEEVAAATADFEQATQLKPNIPSPFIQLALAKAKAGDLPGAKKLFDEATSSFPHHADVDIFKGQFLLQLGDVEGAKRLFSQAETKSPSCPLPAFFSAQIFLQLQNFAQGIFELERAIAIDPKFDTAFQQLAQLYMQSRNMPRALECFEKVIEYTRTMDDLTTALACREAALAQQHVLANNPDLRAIIESMSMASP